MSFRMMAAMHLFKNWYHEKRRATYSLKRYRPYFGATVLDVGAGASAEVFRKELGAGYKAIDVSDSRNKPDFFVDLESGKLPFKDGEFETVLCYDNLEHLDACYEMFGELIRVSSRYVIVSLPNNWPLFIHSFLRGRNITHQLGYGLPKEKPMPGIRHKWFFNLEEAANFLSHQTEKRGARVRHMDFVYERVGFNFLSVPFFYPRLFNLSSVVIERLYQLDDEDRVKLGRKGQILNQILRKLGLPLSKALAAVLRTFSLPFWLLDEIIKHLIWGFGSRYRYLNMFCRQVWIVVEKPS